MNRSITFTILLALVFGVSSLLTAQEKTEYKYVGVKQCSMCHKSEKQGKQFDIWSKSKHAGAYTTLTTAKADEVAAKKGFKTKAAETAECLSCHVTAAGVDAKLLDKSFDMKNGVQCESCHGAGSGYKNMAVMKDKAKAVAAGLTDFKDEAAMEKMCVSCHNEKSPSYKKFEFAKMWPQIQHPVPKK